MVDNFVLVRGKWCRSQKAFDFVVIVVLLLVISVALFGAAVGAEIGDLLGWIHALFQLNTGQITEFGCSMTNCAQ